MDVNLILLKKNGVQKVFPLPSSVTIIGRRSNCDLHVPVTSVSRKHCQLNRDQGVLTIRDLGSRNGTYLNGKRVEEAGVKAGDYVRVGPLTFALQIDGEPESITASSDTKKPPEKESLPDDSRTTDLDMFDDLDDLDEADELDDFDPLADSDSA
jgi:pSer/pThr/pTyr-binding forkhead associated (FHA) protein